MPNWAYTQYHAVGDQEQLQKLHSIMDELESMKAPGLHENGFGSTWLGNLVIRLGGDWEKVYCRGSWDNLLLHDDGSISFITESAWCELNEVRHFIEEKFPGIKLYYLCEENGMGIYQTNDSAGTFFPERYYLWIEDVDSEYYRDLSDVIKTVEDITGSKNIKTLDSCIKSLESYSRKHSDLGFTLEEFTVTPD